MSTPEIKVTGSLAFGDLLGLLMFGLLAWLVTIMAGRVRRDLETPNAPKAKPGESHSVPRLQLGQNIVKSDARWLVLPNYGGTT